MRDRRKDWTRTCKTCQIWRSGGKKKVTRAGDWRGFCPLHKTATWASGYCADHQRVLSNEHKKERAA
jgi:hypothetical protein